jgi:cobyrinic acid a,c-diamide synthase
MNALREKGYAVQPFKVGPDFIDPSYHTLVTRRSSRTLDAWMMGERGIKDSFLRACEGADLAVIEGVMGLFDGMSGKDSFASTAHVARLLKAPVILVLDASKAARSVAAVLMGFRNFEKGIKIVGVVLNNVASDRHAEYLRDAINPNVRSPILGMIRRDKAHEMEERHLGLVPTIEMKREKRRHLVRIARKVAEQIDMEVLEKTLGRQNIAHAMIPEKSRKPSVRLAVALDQSFNFYYHDNFDALRRAGCELEYFSPVNDMHIPKAVDGLMLGGGFPEVLADSLEKNTSMIKSMRKAIDSGLPTYAECGGLMYLSRSIRGYRGSTKKHKMLGLINGDVAMTGRLTLNYTNAVSDGPLLGKAILRGHEFHYSELCDIAPDTRYSYIMSKGKGILNGKDGIAIGDTVLASYTHLHFGGNNHASRIVRACLAHSRR